MKRCIIRISRPGAPAFLYTGLFATTFDAVIHGMSLTVGEQVRISARVLP